MATILLSAAGSAVGGAIGGTAFGLSSAVIGRAVGATLGRVIDAKIMGAGSSPVDVGKIDRFRLSGASEGAAIPMVHGRMRIAGQVIWASRFLEQVETSGGGKGGPSGPKTRTYSYSVSLAIALCEGEVRSVGRVWADGVEVAPDDLGMRVYTGHDDQLPDPKIEAVEGADAAPAYRGIAYVVMEDLDLSRFGNRVPQFSFEVVRTGGGEDLSDTIRAVALMPGSGEYALATTPVHFEDKPGVSRSVNVNSASGKADIVASLDALDGELPNCEAVSLIVSWFGDDLRADRCRVVPKVEQGEVDAEGQPWRVSGLSRSTAEIVAIQDDKPIYGGTPGDASVLEAIADLKDRGQGVIFYPFLLMEQQEGNTRVDPYSGSAGQPVLPWRGRITTALAPGMDGSTDGTSAAEAEVAAFFGQAQAEDFSVGDAKVDYDGTQDTGYRRFILHYAHLCALAGGVEAFCIGSEMRGLTQIRGANGTFPAVAALRQLAADVRGILGPGVKISYAADWSEYFGYQPSDGSGDVYFHLDPLWADDNIDFVGIDNYMPLSDWRDGTEHADAAWGSIYNTDYLVANIAGGEGYDWYYASAAAEQAQIRTEISDGAYDEPWIYRFKDLKNWWGRPHHERMGGVRKSIPTSWQPGSKPIWFTEYGCAAIEKGTNQPNKFLDPKSSESSLPKFSTGARDDAMQLAYYRAMDAFWSAPENNPDSDHYDGQMLDTKRMFAWAWDARPYPQFPAADQVWSDGENYARGHWLTGRSGARALSSVLREVCARSGVTDVSFENLAGVVRGYAHEDTGGARGVLQPLLMTYAMDAIETGGQLVFRSRNASMPVVLDEGAMAWPDGDDARVRQVRDPAAETAGRLQATFIEADSDFEVRAAESIVPDEVTTSVARAEVLLVLTEGEAEALVERWLSEARIARDRISFSLAPSTRVGAGDVVQFEMDGVEGRYRIDRIEDGGLRLAEAVRVDGNGATAAAADPGTRSVMSRAVATSLPVWPILLDLPLITGNEVPHAPIVAAVGKPWPGAVAVYGSEGDDNWDVDAVLQRSASAGRTTTPLPSARPDLWDRGAGLVVDMSSGALSSDEDQSVFAGANLAAIGVPGEDWEVFQFRDAELVGPDLWSLSHRLRGQRGTEPAEWPEGSTVLILNDALRQLDLPSGAIGRARNYRIGPAQVGVDSTLFRDATHTANAIGLRPFAPVHLRASALGGDLELSWVRQTRIDGDRWDLGDVPLGETSEVYQVRVVQGASVLREEIVDAPGWAYTQADRDADGISGAYHIEVAQVSDRFGPGAVERIELND